jgi:hypothetical protein
MSSFYQSQVGWAGQGSEVESDEQSQYYIIAYR